MRKFKIEKKHVVEAYNAFGDPVKEHDVYYIYYRTWFGFKRYLNVKFNFYDNNAKEILYDVSPVDYSEADVSCCRIVRFPHRRGYTKEVAEFIVKNMIHNPDKYIITG